MSQKCITTRSIFAAFMILLYTVGRAQTDTSFQFLDKNLQIVPDSNAEYLGMVSRIQQYWQLQVIGIKTNTRKFNGFYLDSTLLIPEGPHRSYFEDGSLNMIENYKQGKRHGYSKIWNETGLLSDSSYFDNDTLKYSVMYNYWDDGSIKTYASYDSVSGRKIRKVLYENGKTESESDFTGKAGTNSAYYPEGGLRFQAGFNSSGKRTFIKFFREDGTEMSEREYQKKAEQKLDELSRQIQERNPEFRGGEGAFNTYIQKNLKLPDEFRNSIHEGEEIRFSFMLNEGGAAVDIKLITPPSIELQMAIEKMLRSMPAWNMKGKKSFGPVTHRLFVSRF